MVCSPQLVAVAVGAVAALVAAGVVAEQLRGAVAAAPAVVEALETTQVWSPLLVLAVFAHAVEPVQVLAPVVFVEHASNYSPISA
ncbi:hypothetical protein TRICHSKD4_3056 [Roseibium sp. TrichSKD4]|uniref:hypothetical protein n=1 Tax=Roseibium sp. TrichSKD4 TaxID=744980 RepID=UPI0001E56B2E|nr:hypothetical protein [Roseibium sp. TrichSKD4]EFO31961.1 hypothetical protein TRICHSKD4_3056 [Roseibium sp. TrichSKD4]